MVEVEEEALLEMVQEMESDDLGGIEAVRLRKMEHIEAASVRGALMDRRREIREVGKVLLKQTLVELVEQREICEMVDHHEITEGRDEMTDSTENVIHEMVLSGETSGIEGMEVEVVEREVEVEMKSKERGISRTARDRGDELRISV